MLTQGARDQLEAAVAHSTGHRLIACPPLAPLPRQEWILRDAITRAQAAGLTLPRRMSVCWVDRPRGSDITDGTVWHLAAGVVRIWLDANLGPHELQRVVYHELQHASDFARGLQLGRLEFEERAVAFESRMLRQCV
jgi:hypothetical protein